MSALELGKQAYNKAMLGRHEEAINLLTEAISKYPEDNRFYTNRCYSHIQLHDLECAMADAVFLTETFPNYPNGYFQKGEIYLLLKKYKDAEREFNKVLKLTASEETEEKLLEAQIYQIVDKGYDVCLARKAIKQTRNVEEALKYLALGIITKDAEDRRCDYGIQLTEAEEAFLMKEFERIEQNSEDWSKISKKVRVKKKQNSLSEDEVIPNLTDPSNPLKCPTLWVGNISNMSESSLKKLFSKYGKFKSINLLPEKKCAFVNYHDSASAGKAMRELQDYPYGTMKLVIRYPDSVAASSIKKK